MELDRTSIHAGTPVYSSDGEHVGDVENIESTYIRVRSGWFFVKQRYVPLTAIVRFDVDGVYLSVAKDQLDAMGWDAPPAEPDVAAVQASGGDAPTRSAAAGTSDTTATDTAAAQRTRPPDRDAGGAPVAAGHTDLDERVAGLPASTTAPAAFEHGTFEVRARHEELTVSTQARVVEELVVTTHAVERVQTIQDTVRRTRVDITEVDKRATAATSSELTSVPAESAGAKTAAGGASIASTPEATDVSEEDASKSQPRNRRRRLR